MTTHIHKHQTPTMDACIHACEEAHDALQHAVHDCLKKAGRHADAAHIGIMLDCAQMCHTAHDFMLRHSSQHGLACHTCEHICSACAKSCEALGDQDIAAICKRCAEACHACHTAG